jgi:hypothetical protein
MFTSKQLIKIFDFRLYRACTFVIFSSNLVEDGISTYYKQNLQRLLRFRRAGPSTFLDKPISKRTGANVYSIFIKFKINANNYITKARITLYL